MAHETSLVSLIACVFAGPAPRPNLYFMFFFERDSPVKTPPVAHAKTENCALSQWHHVISLQEVSQNREPYSSSLSLATPALCPKKRSLSCEDHEQQPTAPARDENQAEKVEFRKHRPNEQKNGNRQHYENSSGGRETK